MAKPLPKSFWYLQNRILPGYQHPQQVYERRLVQFLHPAIEWLDIGCGHQIFPEWVGTDERALIAGCARATGLDMDFDSLRRNNVLRDRLMANAQFLPFPEGRFDLVTANMVVEHLEHPEAVLREIHRILRPQGRFLFLTPNLNGPIARGASLLPHGVNRVAARVLEQRAGEDVFPTHYRCNTEQQIRRLSAEAGMAVETLEYHSTSALTAVLGPLAAPELLAIRLLNVHALRGFRASILASLRKK